jgi:hypothetical protein
MIEQPHPTPTFDLAAFAERIVWAGIKNARHDPSEMKQRIMLARQCGFVTDEECDFLIPALGLTHE